MVTLEGIGKIDKAHATAITIGTFDGVHIGHRTILDRLIVQAASSGLKSAVLTFFPHPRTILQKDAGLKSLNTIAEKKEILQGLGIDYLVVQPFTPEFSRMSAIAFVRDILVNGLNAKKIVIGYDHRFGRNRTANITDLRSFGSTLDFEVEEIPAKEIDDVSVSSTKIRNALNDGDIKVANKYLGYPYMLSGTVEKGKGLGRQLHFPTANLHIPEDYKLIPKNGAYVVKAVLGQGQVYGMMNIGNNPTVNGTQRTIEVHFFDFDQDLYGKKVQVRILDRLRDEQRFDSVAALKDQLRKDRLTALSLIPK